MKHITRQNRSATKAMLAIKMIAECIIIGLLFSQGMTAGLLGIVAGIVPLLGETIVETEI